MSKKGEVLPLTRALQAFTEVSVQTESPFPVPNIQLRDLIKPVFVLRCFKAKMFYPCLYIGGGRISLDNHILLPAPRGVIVIPFLFNMFLSFRRKEQPWEVVDCKAVEPVPVCYDDEDLDVLSISEADTCGTYVFDVRFHNEHHGQSQLRRAVAFAQEQLLREVGKRGYNILLMEGWRVTLLRKGKHTRVEVQYSGRAAKVAGKPQKHRRPPPFMGVLHQSY